MSGTRIYKCYHAMVARCCNPSCKSYLKYGANGISVCDEWSGENGFLNFYAWSMENGYSDELTIDRINGKEGYNPKNCRWVDYNIQNNNTSRNRMMTYNGKTQTMSQWAIELDMPYQRLNSRINNGKMSVEEAFYPEKMNNRTRKKEITPKREAFNQKKYLYQWGKEFDLSPDTITRRLNANMSIEDAISTRKWQKLPESKIKELFNDYYAGVPVDVIYEKYGITSATLCRYRKRYGKTKRNNSFSYCNRKIRHGY